MKLVLSFLTVLFLMAAASAQPYPPGAIPFNYIPRLRNSSDIGTVPLTFGSTISTNVTTGNVFTVTLTGNATLANPIGIQPGAHYTWIWTQDGAGGHTLTCGGVGSYFMFPSGGSCSSFSTAPSAINTISCLAQDATHLLCSTQVGYNTSGVFIASLTDVVTTRDTLTGTSSAACSHSLNFSQPCNSQYYVAVLP